MAKDDSNKTEDPAVDESESVVEQPTVELDKPSEVEGDLVENPGLEEEAEPDEQPAEEAGEASEDAAEESAESDEEEADAGSEDSTESEPVAEADEAGVYSPPTAADPGDFQPKGSYGFEVITADGKTVKINTPEEADAFAQRLDNEDNLLTAYQFTQFNRNYLRMDSGIEREKTDYESQKAEYEQQQAQEKVRNEQITQWSNEINYLEAKGLLPKISLEQDAANWNDPKNAEVPAIKERLAIFKWMEKENTERKAAGIPEIMSAVDAFRLMSAEQSEDTAKAEKSREISERQARGKMVSGNSSFTPDVEQAGSIIGEGGSLNDLVHEFSASQ